MGTRLVTVARYDIPAKAHLAQNALEAEGIRCVIQDEQLVAMDYLLNLAVGGIKIQVWEEDAERAAALLEALARPDDEENERELLAMDDGDAWSEEGSGAAEELHGEPGQIADSIIREQYAHRALIVSLLSVLIPPLALYSAYLLLMTVSTEGTLSSRRWTGLLIAAVLTGVVMLLSPVWMIMIAALFSGGAE